MLQYKFNITPGLSILGMRFGGIVIRYLISGFIRHIDKGIKK
jgi:hypothetical protein